MVRPPSAGQMVTAPRPLPATETKESLFGAPAIDNEIAYPEEAVAILLDEYHAYEDYRRTEMEPWWNSIYRAYHGFIPMDSPYQSNYTIMEVFRQIETGKALMSKQFFANEQMFQYLPEQEGFEDQARAATAVAHKQIHRQRLDAELREQVDNYWMWGTSYLTYGWRTFRRQNLKINAIHNAREKTWWERSSTEQLQAAPYLTSLGTWNVYIHPWVSDPRNSPFVFIREPISADCLKTLIREGYLDGDAVKQGAEHGGLGLQTRRDTRPTDAPTTGDRIDIGEDQPHELMTVWSGDGWEYCILDQHALVRGQRFEGAEIPLIAQRSYPQSGEGYGIPPARIILEEQRLLNDNMGMIVDGHHYANNSMFQVKQSALALFQRSVFRPGGYVLVENDGDVKQLQGSPGPENLLGFTQFVLQRMSMGTGITPEVGGTGSDQKTATGLVTLKQAAETRLADMILRYMPGLADAYRALYNLNARHLDQRYTLRVAGPEGRFLWDHAGPEVFEPDIDVEVELGNTMEAGPEAAAKWQQAYQISGKDPIVNRIELLKPWFRALGLKRPTLALNQKMPAKVQALDNLNQLQQSGIIPAVEPTDDHQGFLQVYVAFMQSPAGAKLLQEQPAAAANLVRNIQEHEAYAEQMAQAAAASQQTPQLPAPQPTPPVQQTANARTERMFDNAQRGARQQGALVK